MFENIRENLLTFAIVLLPATTLQIPRTPLTIGSLALLFYAVMVWLFTLQLTSSTQLFLKLFLILAVAFCLGFVTNYEFFHATNATGWHDTLAYLFIVYVVFALSSKNVNLSRSILISAITLPFFYLIFFFNPQHFSSYRYLALSLNPNQLALSLCCLPLMNIYFFKSSSRIVKIFLGLSFMVTLFLGYKTKTHALWVAWIAAGIFYLLFIGFKFLYLQHKIWFKLTMILFCGLTAFSIFYLFTHFEQCINVFGFSEGGRGEPHIRRDLWLASFEWIRHSPWVGYGPGSFLNLSNYMSHIQNYEAHNVFLDLLLQGGIFALAAYLWFIFQVAKESMQEPLLMLAFITLLIFSFFHYILRQPIVWIYLYWIYNQCLISRKLSVQPDFA